MCETTARCAMPDITLISIGGVTCGARQVSKRGRRNNPEEEEQIAGENAAAVVTEKILMLKIH